MSHFAKRTQMGSKRTLNMQFVVEMLEQRALLSSTHFAVIGDYGSNLAQEADVANQVKSWNPDYIVTVGDNNYDSGLASTIDTNIGQYYHDFIGNYTGAFGAGSATSRFFPSLGNHDWGNLASNPTGANPYLAYFTLPGNERYYDFVQGPVHFFVVDSDSNEPDGTTSTSVQATWLKNGLAAAAEPWKFVVFHHAAYSSGASHGSTTGMQWPLATWGANTVFSGHEHNYERLFENGIPYFVDGNGGKSLTGFNTPIAGSQFRYSADYGAMLIDADDLNVTLKFISRTGLTIDTSTLSKTLIAPVNPVAAATSNSSITLTWDNGSTIEDGFKIERSLDNVTFTEVGSVAANALTWTNTGLSAGAKYYYRVRAYRGTTEFSAYSTVASATTQALVTATILPTGSTWNYLDTGTDQGTAWRALSFVDTTWKSGPAQLGYGDGDEKTIIGYGPNSSAKYTTSYFRKTFSIANKDAFSSLALRLMRDDGAVVYLNGTEVARSNMPTGTITYATLAPVAIGGADESAFYSFSISPTLLLNGNNVLAVEIHQANGTSTDVSFDAELTGATLPLPLVWADKDIGAVGLAGTASSAAGVYTIKGAGADIWGTADAFNFVYQPWTGNGTIIARVDSVLNTNSWAKAGVMFRESLAANSKFVDLVISPSNGIAFQRRTATGGSSANTSVTGLKAPYWLKLVRSGNTFTASRSTNGTTWTAIGSVSITMTANLYVGLAVTSHDKTKLTTAQFSNVSVTPATAAAAAPTTTALSLSTATTLPGTKPPKTILSDVLITA